jgi:U4/U6 small nuclear ribonucleoprotein PRP3
LFCAGNNKYFDDRLTPAANLNKGTLDRKKKALKFNEPGKYVAIATKQRMQTKLANLQQEIAENARRTGISTAARLAKLSGTSGQIDKTAEYIPQVFN